MLQQGMPSRHTVYTYDVFFSQPTVEALGAAAGSALQAPIQAAYREAFQNLVIPAFERSCQAMYSQVTDTFQRGTKDCEFKFSGPLVSWIVCCLHLTID